MNSSDSVQRRLSHLKNAFQEENDTPMLSLIPSLTSNVREMHKKSDDDVVIVSAVRTPICKAKRGGLKDTHPTDLLVTVLKAVLERVKMDPKFVQDIIVGNVLPPGGGAAAARMAMFLAGFPESVPVSTVNRQCSSGLQAFANIAGEISTRVIDIGIAAGVESMSSYDMTSSIGDVNPKVFDDPKARDCLMSMGETSENVASQFGVSREKQDRFAYESFQKALKAQKEGRFKNEIVPVTTVIKTADGQEKSITISEDDGIRPTTLETLQKLRPAFKENGTSTAGNSSQVSDGAAAVLAMRRSVAKRMGFPILATYRSFAVCGVPPSLMGIGPAFAIPEALKKAGLKKEDIDIYEINEAFASQALYCVEKLGLPMSKVNPNGGGIALGHPLGCTGARQIATLLNELSRTHGRYGVVSMCIGTGMGAAAVFELE
jgi:acetyl-CoA acyltransferase 1